MFLLYYLLLALFLLSSLGSLWHLFGSRGQKKGQYRVLLLIFVFESSLAIGQLLLPEYYGNVLS